VRPSAFPSEATLGVGAKTIFGYPGDGITGIMGALHQAGNDPEFVQARHEEMASLMASAHAKFTGKVGV
jgi:pyruvate dehydrogenase (quinone)